MKIQIRARGLRLTQAQRAEAERRVIAALARFGEEISRVLLLLSDAGAPGKGKHCRLEIGLRPKSVKVEHSDDDLLVAVEFAARRAARSVARALDRERSWQSNVPPLPLVRKAAVPRARARRS